ncbi:hypothetical protein B0X78_05355 [bacterium AM6]|nr:hypothetical protein B0X78_05355 [bacterium AM6]
MQSYNDHALSIAAGMDVRLQRGWFMSLLLGHEQTRGSSRASSIGLRVGYGAVGGAAGPALSAAPTPPAGNAATRVVARRRPAPHRAEPVLEPACRRRFGGACRIGDTCAPPQDAAAKEKR